MAMRRFNQFMYSLETKPVYLYVRATFGAAGAVTIDRTLNNSKGIASVTKLATAGQYQITFSDSYFKLITLESRIGNATGIPVVTVIGIVSGATNVQTKGGGIVTIQYSAGGVATNPAAGDSVYLKIILGDSNV